MALKQVRYSKTQEIHMGILKTVPTNSVTECWHSKPSVQKIQLALKCYLHNLQTYQHTVKIQSLNGVTQGQISLRNMWYKKLVHYSSPLNISYLPRDMGKMTKILHRLQFKASKKGVYLSKSVTVFLYLQYRRAQLLDDDCLATPDPTTSMLLYWINTNRMGTAKNDFCNVFILKKHSLKKNNFIHVS